MSVTPCKPAEGISHIAECLCAAVRLKQLRCLRHPEGPASPQDRKSTRLNSSHVSISYAVFCLKKKITPSTPTSVSHDRILCILGDIRSAPHLYTHSHLVTMFRTKPVCRLSPHRLHPYQPSGR